MTNGVAEGQSKERGESTTSLDRSARLGSRKDQSEHGIFLECLRHSSTRLDDIGRNHETNGSRLGHEPRLAARGGTRSRPDGIPDVLAQASEDAGELGFVVGWNIPD